LSALNSLKIDIMDRNEVLENLCFYDVRNPDGATQEIIDDHSKALKRDSKRTGHEVLCSCDNCFYGRTELAKEILRLIK